MEILINCCSGDVMDANPPVNWEGFMKSLHKPNVKARSQIEFLQIIDQPPDSYSTVYTTLIECLKTASAKPMVITFDLPLWLKASRIVLEKGMPVIVRLGPGRLPHPEKLFGVCGLYHGRLRTGRPYEISLPWGCNSHNGRWILLQSTEGQFFNRLCSLLLFI